MTLAELRRLIEYKPEVGGIDPKAEQADLEMALERFSSTVVGEGMTVAVHAAITLQLCTWMMPTEAGVAAPLQAEIDRVRRFGRYVPFNLWFPPDVDY